MAIKSLEELDLKGKRVLVRVDYNVPINSDGQITNDTRITASLPTLKILRDNQCKITLMSHLGRPKGEPDPRFGMKPVATRLGELLECDVAFCPDLDTSHDQAEVQLLENLRFWPGEKKNDADFAARLATYGDVYINDAFGTAHRAHASMDAVARRFHEKGAGLLMQKELTWLRDELRQPKKPFVAILGGAKVSDKLKLIGNLVGRVNQLIVGGGMSYTFLAAQGIEVGASIVERDFLDEARNLLERCKAEGVEMILPLDHVIATEFKEEAPAKITLDEAIEPGYMGLDIGPESINRFNQVIAAAGTVVWNGPMGVFEWEAFSTGTISVAEALAESDAASVIGGGDSVAAIYKAGVQDRMTHISTGGGASLELLGGNILPGVAALEQ